MAIVFSISESAVEPRHSKKDPKESWLPIFLAVFILAAVLFGLIAPVIGRPPGPNRSVESLSKLKQLATGLQIYVSDYHDLLPDKASWQTSLMPYVKNEQLFVSPYKELPGSYAMNSSLSGVKWLPREEHELAPLLFESRLKGPNSFGGREDIRVKDPKLCVAFSDGSAKRLLLAEAERLVWIPE